ncbi:MAG: hypothetical protein GF320_17645 [Armatimonadia bacterium]|nr:hypothetical protein [Armatimonadia bacterium]
MSDHIERAKAYITGDDRGEDPHGDPRVLAFLDQVRSDVEEVSDGALTVRWEQHSDQPGIATWVVAVIDREARTGMVLFRLTVAPRVGQEPQVEVRSMGNVLDIGRVDGLVDWWRLELSSGESTILSILRTLYRHHTEAS